MIETVFGKVPDVGTQRQRLNALDEYAIRIPVDYRNQVPLLVHIDAVVRMFNGRVIAMIHDAGVLHRNPSRGLEIYSPRITH